MGTLGAALVVFAGLAAAPGPLTFQRPFVQVSDVPGNLMTGDGRPITVLDAREAAAWRRGHIPGAQRIDWTDYREGILREGRLPKDLERTAARLARVGVDGERPVLVCGAAADGWGEEGRIAWMLRYLGHPDVAILDGGCAAWGRAGRPVLAQLERPPAPGRFQAAPRAELRAQLADVEGARARGDAQLLDVRTREEFDGATPYLAPRGGHIPGARHLHFKDLLGPQGKVLPGHVLRERLKAAGVDPDRPVIAYCTGGVRSAFAAEVLRGAGLDARNYDGSWWEWASHDELPVEETGEKPGQKAKAR